VARAVVRLTVELPQELYNCLEEEARRSQASHAGGLGGVRGEREWRGQW